MYILLCCAAGMSTSMVVRKMQEEANKQGKNYKIKAVDSELVKLEIIDQRDYGMCDGLKVLKQAEQLVLA